jgi:phage-related minor tail protein
MLGKALQSPTEGLKGLTKEFGKLNPEQTLHIENLARQGAALDAQRAILDLVEGRVGGLAKTMNTGLNKATTDLHKSWHELLETMGRQDAIGGLPNAR